jgi:hypothetical protein
MNRWKWAERCPNVPSPLVGEGQGEGYNTHCLFFVSAVQQVRLAVVLQYAHEITIALGALLPPLSLSLPHKGGGNRGARTFATHAMRLWADFQPGIGAPFSFILAGVRA